MLQFDQNTEDDPGFLREVAALVQGAIEVSAPTTVVIVKIDTWFGANWLGFSHKVMGAFGVSFPTELVIPPFVPNRVVYERIYERAGASFSEKIGGLPIHIEQTSEANARRKLSDLHSGAALFWWTGNTRHSGRGALMAYLPTPDGHTGWYAELQRNVDWGFGALRGVGISELRALRGRAAQPRIAADEASRGN
jgi:hypothetical protein